MFYSPSLISKKSFCRLPFCNNELIQCKLNKELEGTVSVILNALHLKKDMSDSQPCTLENLIWLTFKSDIFVLVAEGSNKWGFLAPRKWLLQKCNNLYLIGQLAKLLKSIRCATLLIKGKLKLRRIVPLS